MNIFYCSKHLLVKAEDNTKVMIINSRRFTFGSYFINFILYLNYKDIKVSKDLLDNPK